VPLSLARRASRTACRRTPRSRRCRVGRPARGVTRRPCARSRDRAARRKRPSTGARASGPLAARPRRVRARRSLGHEPSGRRGGALREVAARVAGRARAPGAHDGRWQSRACAQGGGFLPARPRSTAARRLPTTSSGPLTRRADSGAPRWAADSTGARTWRGRGGARSAPCRGRKLASRRSPSACSECRAGGGNGRVTRAPAGGRSPRGTGRAGPARRSLGPPCRRRAPTVAAQPLAGPER
jgi:hypothetical protein